ncbi:hypothetical protein P43SY_005381 [Pythium insidiosum]|uniref:OPA3-like protein n=1 Tax=Pythium insidiosum TaxID=114742 RepID=A0AAD5M9E9_PYTIN|nr:hypothetical protein P43SY_005381 [Pythium insidiosum]
MVLPLPMIKLGGLIVRTLTKPLAKVVKTRSKTHPRLNALCHRLGQQQHHLLFKFHMGFRGVSNFTIKDLPADQAVEKGADLIGELIIFSVAVAVASFEYSRSTTKSKEKEQLELEKKRRQEEEIERRFNHLEEKVIWLEAQLAVMGRMVEDDIGKRIATAELEDGIRTELVLTRKAQRSNSLSEDTDSDSSSEEDDVPSQGTSSYVASLWRTTSSAVVGLFR